MPIPDIHPLTNQEVGVKAALVPVDFASVKNISEDVETGYAIIVYKGGGEQKTYLPFVELVASLYNQGAVNFEYLKITSKYSKSIKNTFK
jgi:hypothetical protein